MVVKPGEGGCLRPDLDTVQLWSVGTDEVEETLDLAGLGFGCDSFGSVDDGICEATVDLVQFQALVALVMEETWLNQSWMVCWFSVSPRILTGAIGTWMMAAPNMLFSVVVFG